MGGPDPEAWRLVGRDVVVGRVMAALRRGRGTVLVGEAGVGKTALARHAAALARERGHRVAEAVGSSTAATIRLGALAPLLPVPAGRTDDLGETLRMAAAAIVGDGDPVVLFVDDAHLLDEASATVVHHVALGGGVVLATVRRGEPCPDAITALWKDGHADRVDLGPIERADVDELVVEVLGGPVDGVTTSVLWERTQGNPLYLRELLLGALDAGFLVDSGGLWRLRPARTVTPRLTDLVEARIARVEGPARDALDLLAVAGELPLAVFEALAPGQAGALERSGLVEVRVDRRRRHVTLAHPLHTEVLGELLPRTRRLELTETLIAALGATGARRRDDILRLALWQLECGGDAPAELMTEAARRVAAMHDDHVAEQLARVAVEAGGGADALRLLGTALARLGRTEEAEQVFAGIPLEGLDDDARVLHTVARTDNLFWALGRADEALAVAGDALDRLTAPESRSELAGNRAVYAFMAGRPTEAIESLDDVMHGAAGRVAVITAMALAPSLALTGRPVDGVAVAERAIVARLDRARDERLTELPMLRMALGHALTAGGALARADEQLRIGYEEAVAGHDVHAQAWTAMIRGQNAWYRGLPATAGRWFAEGEVKFREVGLRGLERVCVAGRVVGAVLTGAGGDASEWATAVRGLDPHRLPALEPEVVRILGWERALRGDTEGALAECGRAADLAAEIGARQQEVLALHDRVSMGDRAVADRLRDAADGQQGDLVPAVADHALALAAGDPGALEQASVRLDGLGARLRAAEAAAQASAAFQRAGDDRPAARCARRSHDLAAGCEGARTAALGLAGTAGRLTAREREVALLIADGVPNKVAAQRLGLSVRTVEAHLRNAYTKLGCDRDGLADALG